MGVCVGLNVEVDVGEIVVDVSVRVGVGVAAGIPVEVNVAGGKGVSSVGVGSSVERQAANTIRMTIRLQAVVHLFTQVLP